MPVSSALTVRGLCDIPVEIRAVPFCMKGPVSAIIAAIPSTGQPYGRAAICGSGLFPDTQPLDNRSIPCDILILQVVKKAAPLTDHSQETSARMVVFRMSFEMLRQVGDLLAQNGDLYLRRPGIRRVSSICIDDFRLFFYRK